MMAPGRAVDVHIVDVADAHIAIPRMEKHVAEADVLIAKPFCVQAQKTVGKMERRQDHGREAGVYAAAHIVHQGLEPWLAKRHQVTEGGRPHVRHQFEGPPELVIGRTHLDRFLQAFPQRGVEPEVARVVPLQSAERILELGAKDLSLAAAAEHIAHNHRPAGMHRL